MATDNQSRGGIEEVTEDLIEASSLGAEGMAELYNRTPGHRLAAIRRKTAVCDAVDDLAVALGGVTPLVRIQARDAMEDLARHINDASGDDITAARILDSALVRVRILIAIVRTRHDGRSNPDLAARVEQASAVLVEAGGLATSFRCWAAFVGCCLTFSMTRPLANACWMSSAAPVTTSSTPTSPRST